MAKRIEELMKLKEEADIRAEQRKAAVATAANEKTDELLAHVKTIARASVFAALEEIEASDDPKAAIAAIRKRLSL